MCGIIGALGEFDFTTEKIVRDMHLLDTVRGRDSSGYVIVDKTGEVKHGKELGGPTNLFDFDPVFTSVGVTVKTPKIYIGHNRAKTVGDNKLENAHPFVHGNIHGVHNGTLTAWRQAYDNKNEFEVDSDALIHSIYKNGIEETWEKLEGAATVVWWDKEDGHVYMTRNEKRPMYVWKSERKDLTYFASDPRFIDLACNFHSEKLSEADGESKRHLKINSLYKFKVTSNSCDIVDVTPLKKHTKIYSSPATHFSNVVKKNTTTVTTSYPKQSSTNGKVRQLNTNWAKDTEKLEKESRGVLFSISYKSTHFGQELFFGKFNGEKNGGKMLCIIPNSEKDIELLKKEVGKSTVFKTMSRMRLGKSPAGIQQLKISSANIRKMADGLPLIKTTPQKKVGVSFTGPKGRKLSKEHWLRMVNSDVMGSCCSVCGNPLDIQDHEQHVWLTDNVPGQNEVVCDSVCGEEYLKLFRSFGA